jgi:crossover junction endodeoxyribonuclease RusA
MMPWPPSVNHYYERNRSGGVRIGKAGLKYRDAIALLFRGFDTISGPISVDITAHPPDNRRRDLDNLLKCTLDALQKAGVYQDDFQIDRLTVSRACPVKDGRLIVRIENICEM